jgi:hypothetical protein
MAHIAGFGRDQLLLLPDVVDDYVEADNPVRFIDVCVDGLDLAAAGFGRVEAKAMGRPGYAPGDLLKLHIYGYLNRVRSSRRLERECRCNVETIDVVVGRGYFKIEDIEACEKVGCIPHVLTPQRGSSVREGFFRKDEFRYDAGCATPMSARPGRC